MQYAHWKGALMLEGEFPVAFALKLARKDIQLALEAAAATGIELAMAEATERRLARGVELGYGEDDSAATFLVARRAGPGTSPAPCGRAARRCRAWRSARDGPRPRPAPTRPACR